MTPIELQALFNEAANTDNAKLALEAAKIWTEKQWWFSDRAFIPNPPTGAERLIHTQQPGICQLCLVYFSPGTDIMWRTGCSSHIDCWEKKFNKKVFEHANSI